MHPEGCQGKTGNPYSTLELLTSQSERLLPIAVLSVAAFLRLYDLATIPGGLLTDEAFNGLDALRIIDGDRPIFLVENNGREPLFIYLQAISIAFLGQSALSLRVVSAILGIMTVVVSYFLAKRMFGNRVALLATGWLALSLWHLIFSRIAWRTISLPLIVALGIYCFWRGLEEVKTQARVGSASPILSPRSALWFALGGVMIGLSLYTYSTARFAPFVVVALALYLALLHRNLFPIAFPGFLLALTLTILVFLPQGLFFANHPDSFVERAREVTIVNPDLHGGNPGQAILNSAFRTLGMFFIKGDAGVDKNIPGRPIFDPVSALLMLFGIAIAVRRFRQPAYGFLIIWLVVMFAPNFLAVSGTPNYLRTTGLIPGLFVLPALGAVWLWEAWESRLSTRHARTPRFLRAIPLLLVTLAFVGGTFHTYHSYFRLWAQLPKLARSFNADSFVTLETARTIAQTDKRPVFLAGRSFDDRLVRPGLQFLLSNQPDAQFIITFDPTSTFIFPGNDTVASYLFADHSPDVSLLDRYFDHGSSTVAGVVPSGRPINMIQLRDPLPPFEPGLPIQARFGDRILVYGFDLPKDVRSGELMTVRWYWRILANDQPEFLFTHHLFGEADHRRGGVNQPGFPPGRWPVGTVGLTTFEIIVDPFAPTGAYWLRVALYDRGGQTLSELPVFDAQGNRAGKDLRLGPIKIHGRPPAPTSEGLVSSPPAPDNFLPATFADQIDLLGYNLAHERLLPGQTLELTLFWASMGRPLEDYTVFVHLLDSDGQLRGQTDSPATSGKYPTSVWDAGEFIADSHTLSLPNDLPGGEYKLAIGLYDPETGRRLQTVDGSGNTTGDSVTISGLMVQPE